MFEPFYPVFMSSSETMCERCDGLCCRVYDIVDNDTWKRVKAAGDKCGYLDIKNRCRIYKTRSNHIGYRHGCQTYDCLEAWPIVTIFARRLWDHEHKAGILSSLLETIRLRVEESPESRADILRYSAILLNNLTIDSSIHIAIKVIRIKIERWEKWEYLFKNNPE